MSVYFDEFAQKIARVNGLPSAVRHDMLRILEEELVFDVTVAAEWPGFPADLRDEAYQVILDHGVETQPPGHCGVLDLRNVNDYLSELCTMAGDLHTVFHSVAERQLSDFTDNPRMPLLLRAADGQERRARMVKPPA